MEVITLRAQRFTKRGEHADSNELIMETHAELLQKVKDYIEDYTGETKDGWGFMAQVKIAVGEVEDGRTKGTD